MTFTSRSLRLSLLGAGAALAMTSVAIAATPENGTIGKASPRINWSGVVQFSGAHYNAWTDDPSIPCEAPACDPFMMEVADAGVNVTLKLNIQNTNVDGSDPGAGIRIKFPDDSYQYTQGTAGEKTTMQLKLKALKAGPHEVTTVASHVCCGDDPYTMVAEIPEIVNAPAAPAPAQPAPAQPPAPAPAPAPQLTITAKGTSAKSLAKKRKYAISATTTAPLTNVVAALKKGKRSIGTAKLSRLEGTQKIMLKVSKKAAKKLKKGTYAITVSGVDSENRRTTTAVKVKFKK